MKFVDKNGNEYPDIISAWEAFKCPCQCADCNLNGVNEGLRVCSMKWITAHPYAAAYLMGYEIITTLTQNNTNNERSDDNMVKPRICNVLGVEVGEKFSITYTFHSTMITRICRIDENGNIVSDDGSLPAEALSQIINFPDRIVRKTNFTQHEIDSAKNLLDVVGDGELRKVADMVTLKVDGKTIYLRKNAFQSLQKEQSIKLSEIANSTP